jgi:cytidyltransferase-like protein
MTRPAGLVLTHGVFDLMHSNHIAALREARALGDRLIVGVHADAVVEAYKRRPVLPAEERLAQVSAVRWVDDAYIDDLPETAESYEARYQRFRPDHYVYFGPGFEAEFEPMARRGVLRRLPYHDGISTSRIIDTVRRRLADGTL